MEAPGSCDLMHSCEMQCDLFLLVGQRGLAVIEISWDLKFFLEHPLDLVNLRRVGL